MVGSDCGPTREVLVHVDMLCCSTVPLVTYLIGNAIMYMDTIINVRRSMGEFVREHAKRGHLLGSFLRAFFKHKDEFHQFPRPFMIYFPLS